MYLTYIFPKIYGFIIYPTMLSVLILLISKSVIRYSGSPHCGFLNPYHPSLKLMFFSMHEVL